MTYPVPLPVRKGKRVLFAPPLAVVEGTARIGTVEESVQTGPHEDKDWGYYLYISELIKWDDPVGSKSIRLSYYYAPFGASRWFWGGQYSIEDEPYVIKELLEKTVMQKHWFDQ